MTVQEVALLCLNLSDYCPSDWSCSRTGRAFLKVLATFVGGFVVSVGDRLKLADL
jgi:hypothetical protein